MKSILKVLLKKKSENPETWIVSLEKNSDFVVKERDVEIARFQRDGDSFRTISIGDFRNWTKATNTIQTFFKTAYFEK